MVDISNQTKMRDMRIDLVCLEWVGVVVSGMMGLYIEKITVMIQWYMCVSSQTVLNLILQSILSSPIFSNCLYHRGTVESNSQNLPENTKKFSSMTTVRANVTSLY